MLTKKSMPEMGLKQNSDNTFKLIDETNPLEFHFRNETIEICNHRFHKFLNIHNAYIEMKQKQ